MRKRISPRRKLNTDAVEQIRKLVASGKPQKVMAIEYKLTEGAISKIVNNKYYK